MALLVELDEFKKSVIYYSGLVEKGRTIYITKDYRPLYKIRPLKENDTPYTDTLLEANVGTINFDDSRDNYFKEKYQLD